MELSDYIEPIIFGERIELHHISPLRLVTLLESPEEQSIYDNRTYTNPYRVLIDDKGPLAWRVPQVMADESSNKWFMRWIVLQENQKIIGSTSFHRVPDENGLLDIGLGIDERFHTQGFGYEAVKGMWEWVSKDPLVKILRYTVSPTNLASIALINKFDFPKIGQQIDEEDGPEDIYELSVNEFLDKL